MMAGIWNPIRPSLDNARNRTTWTVFRDARLILFTGSVSRDKVEQHGLHRRLVDRAAYFASMMDV
jgi:hypothetical protein